MAAGLFEALQDPRAGQLGLGQLQDTVWHSLEAVQVSPGTT